MATPGVTTVNYKQECAFFCGWWLYTVFPHLYSLAINIKMNTDVLEDVQKGRIKSYIRDLLFILLFEPAV